MGRPKCFMDRMGRSNPSAGSEPWARMGRSNVLAEMGGTYHLAEMGFHPTYLGRKGLAMHRPRTCSTQFPHSGSDKGNDLDCSHPRRTTCNWILRRGKLFGSHGSNWAKMSCSPAKMGWSNLELRWVTRPLPFPPIPACRAAIFAKNRYYFFFNF